MPEGLRPAWAALPPEVLARMGHQLLQQTSLRSRPTQAVHFASVCRAFRAATLVPQFWSDEQPWELNWRLDPICSNGLVLAWAPHFHSANINWGPLDATTEPEAWPDCWLEPAPDGPRRTVIITASPAQGPEPDDHTLAKCLVMLQRMGPITTLILNSSALTQTQVKLLASLQVHNLVMTCWSCFRLSALPATQGSTKVTLAETQVAPNALIHPIRLSWQAMTASRESEFRFVGRCVVEGYSAGPLRGSSVTVCNLTADDVFVSGLPWEAMRANLDGWETQHYGFIKR